MLACKSKNLQGLCNKGVRASLHVGWVGKYTPGGAYRAIPLVLYADSMDTLEKNENLRGVGYP